MSLPLPLHPYHLTLYHVTPAVNANGIKHDGLLVSRCAGNRQVVWFVDSKNIEWGLLHVAHKHQTWDLIVLTCNVDTPRRTAFPGVYTSKFDISPDDILQAVDVNWYDDPDFVILPDDELDVQAYVHGQPCPACKFPNAMIAIDAMNRIKYSRCARCELTSKITPVPPEV